MERIWVIVREVVISVGGSRHVIFFAFCLRGNVGSVGVAGGYDYGLQFQGVTVPPGTFPGPIFIPAGEGAYTVAGDLNLYDNGFPVQQNVPLTGPFSFRFTNALIACSGGPCSPVTLNFAAFVTFAGTAPTNVGGSFGIEGIGSSGRFVSVGVEGTEALPRVIANISTAGNFSAINIFPAGFVLTNGPSNMIFLMGLGLSSGMSEGDSIFLPDSLFLQLNSVPEPGTLAIVGAGLAGVIWFRRRLS